MGFNEGLSPDGLMDSLRDVYHKQSLFYRNLRECAEADLGPQAVEAIHAGLVDFGRWRATINKTQPAVVVDGQTPASWLKHWECADLLMFSADPHYRLAGEPNGVRLSLSAPPEAGYFRGSAQSHWLTDFWTWTMEGVADEFKDLGIEVADSNDEWTLLFTGDGLDPTEPVLTAPAGVLDDPTAAVTLIRQSSVHNGALFFFLARAIIRAFDASGEASVRAGVRAIGRERGTVLRERHEAQGKELNLKTLMEDWDGPLVSVWQWRDEGELNANQWLQDCTWCPYAAAWNQFGEEGRKLGYLYDVELHTTMYNTYLPGVVVRWDKLMTRGDATCNFRIEVDPQLSTRPAP